MNYIYDLIIIGGGPAGYTAALYAARAGLDTIVVEKLSAGGQLALTDIIENYPGFDEGIDAFSLGIKMQQGAERFGTKTEYGEVISVSLDEKIKKIELEDKTLYSKTIIIATGANPRELGIEHEKKFIGKGIHYCAHCDGRFYSGKNVIVVGGGNSAVSDALYLSNIAKKVILIHRRDTLKATKIYHSPLFNSKNIEILWNNSISKIYFDQKIIGCQTINLKDNITSDLECDAIFVSIGRKPATECFNNKINLDENGYIIADESTKTNLPGVFAAGDVRTKAFRQVITAASDGAVAAYFAEDYISKNK